MDGCMDGEIRRSNKDRMKEGMNMGRTAKTKGHVRGLIENLMQ